MGQLYILCGYPFAGKSTFTKELIKRFGFSLVGLDEINAERGLGQTTGKGLGPKEWGETYDIAYQRIAALLSQGKTVLYDATNFTKDQRDKPGEIARQHGVESTVIFLDIPIETVRQRWQENREINSRFDVRDEDFAQVVDNFQVPTEDENVLIYDQTIPVEEWVNKNSEIFNA